MLQRLMLHIQARIAEARAERARRAGDLSRAEFFSAQSAIFVTRLTKLAEQSA